MRTLHAYMMGREQSRLQTGWTQMGMPRGWPFAVALIISRRHARWGEGWVLELGRGRDAAARGCLALALRC